MSDGPLRRRLEALRRLPADRAPEPLTDGELSELVDEAGRGEFLTIIDKLPLAYNDVTAIWRTVEKKNPGNGG